MHLSEFIFVLETGVCFERKRAGISKRYCIQDICMIGFIKGTDECLTRVARGCNLHKTSHCHGQARNDTTKYKIH